MEPGAPKIGEPSLRLLRSPARDDRGRDVWPLLGRSLRGMKWDKPRQRDYRRLVFGSQWRMFLIVTAGTLLLLAPTVAVTVGFLSGRIAAIERGVVPAFPIKMLFPIQFGSLALAFAAAFLFNRWYVRRNAQRRIIPGLLDQRHCGACVYPLENAPVENDGCTVCPECGSAWRLPSN